MINPVHTQAFPYLNRVALNKMVDLTHINPYRILQNTFDYLWLDEMLDQFSTFCEAAMSEKFNYEEDVPGRLLQFSELLEQLLEACYLISIRPKTKEKKYDSSFIAITQFFTARSLQEWKLALHEWTVASLSNYSVASYVNPSTILPFVQNIEKLMNAAHHVKVCRKSKVN